MAYFTMSSLALKWTFRRPVTSRYPFEPRNMLAGSRGTLELNRETCVFCSLCAKRCPTGALLVNRAQKKWAIDRLRCIACAYCVEICPKKSLVLTPAHAATALTRDRDFL